jgi:uncharacterized membrane protein
MISKGTSLPLLMSLALLAGCAADLQRPVFYPDGYTQSVGEAQRNQDIDECMAMARQSGVAEHRDQVGEKAARGALVGGVASGVWGLIRGDVGRLVVAGAAAGAATGGAVGAVDSAKLSPTFKRFVQRCLQDRGYEVIGWE